MTTKTPSFTSETSAMLRLAGTTTTKMLKVMRDKVGITVPAEIETNVKALRKLALEHGWGWHVGNVVNSTKKAEYGAAQHCDDPMANAFAAFVRSINPETHDDFLDIAKLKEVAKANGISMDRWLHCNIGQQRMNLGNVLRGKMRRGFEVTVGDKTWNKGSTMAEKAPKTKKPAKKTAKAKATKAKAPRKAKVAKIAA